MKSCKERRPWCSLIVELPSLFVTPSGEQLDLPVCWRRTSLPIISRVLVPTFFSGDSIVVDVEGVAFRPRAVVGRKEVVAGHKHTEREGERDR